MCPHCRQNAPIVYRGVTATCTACGRPRAPLTGASVNLAGQPSKIGGTVARGFGWATLAGGWSFAALVGFVIWAVSSFSPAFWVATGLIGFFSSLVGWMLLRSGKQLVQSGAVSEQATKTQAVLALAAARGGTLVAWDVARALDVTPQEADELLTKLAKEQLDLVKVDIDDEGRVLYRFTSLAWANMRPPPMRVAHAAAPHTRVAASAWTPGAAAQGEPIRRGEDELEDTREDERVDAYGVGRAAPRAR